MTFTSPLGLLWLLAVPAVVAMHLYRRRLHERSVAGLFLFEGVRLVADAGRTRTRLLRTPSLWLECLAAAVLALWLAGPSFGGSRARHVVFVLDDSASMATGRTVAGVLAAVRARLGALASGDRVTVLRTGPRPDVLVGPRALPGEVAARLPEWRPVRARHDPLPTLDLARELAAGPGEVVFCTDEAPPPGCEDLEVLAFGSPLPNCALLTAQRLPRLGGEGEELRLRITGHGAVAATTLAVLAGEQELLRRPVELRDGVADVALPLPAGLGALRVQLAGDGMAIDDTAWLLPAPPRTVAVCDLLPEALRQQLGVRRVFDALSGFRAESDPLRAQLVLTAQPGQVVAGQTEVVVAPGDGERLAFRGPFVVDRSHPWLAGVRLHGVVWLCGARALPGQVLVAAGSQALLAEEFVDHGRRLWIDLDASAGNAVRAPDWPLLWSNVLDACRAEVPGPEQCNVVLGEEARYRRSMVAGAPDARLSLEGPDGRRSEGRGSRTVGWVLEEPGLHRVLGADGRELGQFAARFFDPSESDLRGLQTKVWPRRPEAAAAAVAGSLRDTTIEQRVLALLLLLLVLADWWVLGRRGDAWRSP